MPRYTQRWTPEVRAELRARHLAGETYGQIAREYGVSDSRIRDLDTGYQSPSYLRLVAHLPLGLAVATSIGNNLLNKTDRQVEIAVEKCAIRYRFTEDQAIEVLARAMEIKNARTQDLGRERQSASTYSTKLLRRPGALPETQGSFGTGAQFNQRVHRASHHRPRVSTVG